MLYAELKPLNRETILAQELAIESLITQPYDQNDSIPEQLSIHQIDNEDNEDLSGYKCVNPLMVPLKEISSLSPEEKEILRKNHPNLAEYIFMTQREKSKYFHEKNLKYNKEMSLPGSLPARKIQFKRTFEIKLFTME